MEATRGWVWAQGCLPVARTRAEVGQGAGSAVDFKIAPCLPRTLLLRHGLGGSWPCCAPCAAGEVLHARPAPLQRCSCCGAGRQGAVCRLRLPHAWPWPCTGSAQGQAACGHPQALSSQGTHPRSCPGQAAGLQLERSIPISWHCPQQMSVPGTIHPSGLCLEPHLWDGTAPSAYFPQGTGLGQEQTGYAIPEPPRE